MSAVTEVSVPDLGDFADVPVIEIHVALGDLVSAEDPLITLESDKATMDVPSPAAGTVSELRVKVGDLVSRGSPILMLDTGGRQSQLPALTDQQEPPPAQVESAQAAAAETEAPADFDGVHAGPGARRLARELGTDITSLSGTGPKGRITKDDVIAGIRGSAAPLGPVAPGASAPQSGIPEIPAQDFSRFGPVEIRPLSRIQRLSGPQLHRSWLNIPHVTQNDEADITELDAYRRDLDAAARADGDRVTLLAFLMKASASALRDYPRFNSSLTPEKDALIFKGYYHLGIAVDTPEGLVVPVIRDVDRKGIRELSRELSAVSARARDGKLDLADLQGACFTISSLGGIGGTGFTPIVNAPEVAILGVSRAKTAPVWDGTAFMPRLMLPVSLSYDHRVIDGALAARFARYLCQLLEDIRSLLLLPPRPVPTPALLLEPDVDITVPDIGHFIDVPVIEVHVAAGDVVAAEDPVITLESDKATLDVPASATGTVGEVAVRVGDRVSAGDLIMRLDAGPESGGPAAVPVRERVTEDAAPAPTEPPGYGSPSGIYEVIEVTVPDIGHFVDVPVIEVHVAAGDVVAAEDPLITLESDKATLDIPAPVAGTITAVHVAAGDHVSAGHVIADLRTGQQPVPEAPATEPSPAAEVTTVAPPGDITADVLVLGAGPGGYTAAFRAADLGKNVVLVDRGPTLGGVCLNVGCIPSKALLHAAKVIAETREMSEHGIVFGAPAIDVDKLRAWKDGVVGRLTGGLAGLARQRKVITIRGYGRFASPHQLQVELAEGGTTAVDFDQAIIAAGSEPLTLPFIPRSDPRVVDSTGALELGGIPHRLLILGGGIIGLEMATVYHELGAKVTIVELMDQLIPGADKDLIGPLTKRVIQQYENIYLKTSVTNVEARPEGLVVSFDGAKAPATDTFDRMLVAVGRRPNGKLIGAEAAGVTVDERGFILVDKQLRTNVAHIFAIGDLVGHPMLAHKAMHEGRVAAEVAAGKNSFFDARMIPSVAYTDPEVAWAGTTENEARAAGVKYGKGVFPWAASGRSLSLGRAEGLTKVLFDDVTGHTIGCGIVGPSAGELIAEAALAIEMGADAADIGLTIHPHPTLSETVAMAAEAFEGTITDLYLPRRTR